MKVIGVHLDRCTGCKTCELYCATERGSNSKFLLQAAQEKPLPRARVRVEGCSQMPVALQCRHCRQAPCLDACLTGALVRDPDTQLVVIRENRCIGCWTCTLFCPYGVIYPWPQRGIALKCDRCLYMEHPVCVDVCPTRALELVDLDEFEDLLHQRRTQTIKEAAAGKTAGKLLLLDSAK
ncbi:MAG: 4Fe-4S dicluster domain-containing protein [Thermodesulfobacteriota bacterium]